MDFTLDKKHEMARSLFKEFAETEVKPLAQETDETEAFPAETVKKMQKYGFMGIPVPKEYGGQVREPCLTQVFITFIRSLSSFSADFVTVQATVRMYLITLLKFHTLQV